MIPPDMDHYIQAVVDRFFACICPLDPAREIGSSTKIHGEACLLNFRHLALAACRELAVADLEYRTRLEQGNELFGQAKVYGQRLETDRAHLHNLALRYQAAFREIEQAIIKAETP